MSDTPAWCKINLDPSTSGDMAGLNVVFSADFFHAYMDVPFSHFDFGLFRHLDYNLMLYGTYAFWATYLAGAPVYLPSDYLGARSRHHQVMGIQRANITQYRFIPSPPEWS